MASLKYLCAMSIAVSVLFSRDIAFAAGASYDSSRYGLEVMNGRKNLQWQNADAGAADGQVWQVSGIWYPSDFLAAGLQYTNTNFLADSLGPFSNGAVGHDLGVTARFLTPTVRWKGLGIGAFLRLSATAMSQHQVAATTRDEEESILLKGSPSPVDYLMKFQRVGPRAGAGIAFDYDRTWRLSAEWAAASEKWVKRQVLVEKQRAAYDPQPGGNFLSSEFMLGLEFIE